MPKIFLIKNRLHQQQQRLLETQNLLQHKNEDDRLVPPLSPNPNRNHDDDDNHHHLHSQLHQHASLHRQTAMATTPTTPSTPTTPEPLDSPRNSSPSLATTSDCLKALHIQNKSHTAASSPSPASSSSRSSSPPAKVLNLHKHAETNDAVAEEPLSLVSTLTYLGRKRFHQYHQLQLQQQQKLQHQRNLRISQQEENRPEETNTTSKGEEGKFILINFKSFCNQDFWNNKANFEQKWDNS